ncbi:MAG: acyltransferase [Candidatus Pacebacteria bacterium]|nr:acyltransferase [Candidatus Paceibacterota bacterium]
MKHYYSLLDAVRFFAAFWVMNFHYFLSADPVPQLHWYRFGNLGVQLFFIISGFVIVHSLKGKTLKEFATGRFWRLFPLFWVLCTVTYALTIFLPDVRYALHFGDYIRTMTMLGDVFNGITGPTALIDPSYWTLTVELIFYAGIALFVKAAGHRNIRYFLLAWLVVSATAFLFHVDENFYVKLLLVRHASYFVFGSALALIVGKEAVGRSERLIDWSLLFTSALYATYIHTRSLPAYAIPNPNDAFVISLLHVGFFLCIPLLVYLSGYVTHARILQVLAILGGLTYPLYLLHQRIGNMMIDLLTSISPVSWFTLVICFEIVIIGVAYFVYVYEKKMRSWILKRMGS